MKILVTGASGLLGLNLSLQMHTQHQIIGVDRSKLAHTPFDLIKLDLLDLDALPKLLSESKPDAVIHCAANALVDACELHPDSASTLNAVLPGRLAKLCAEREIQFLHISTDAFMPQQNWMARLPSSKQTPLPQLLASISLAGV